MGSGGNSRAEEVGKRIKQARLENDGMKQRELADLLGVSERSVIAYESGEVIPYRFMRDLERLLGKSAAWILHGETGPPEDAVLASILEELRELRREVQGLRKR